MLGYFKSIRQGLRQLSLDKLQWILKILIEMAEIIESLHDHKIIHKGINTSNFLILPHFKRLHILDFGLATRLDRYGNEPLQTHTMEGALPYISPEQTGRTNKNEDYRTDFYSFGVSIYELITGQKPFSADDPLQLVILLPSLVETMN